LSWAVALNGNPLFDTTLSHSRISDVDGILMLNTSQLPLRG
jgi:hypothetical protein